MDTVRIGKVTVVEPSSGKVRVMYTDKGNEVTSPIPVIANGIFTMPSVNDMVLVVHLSNGPSTGVCLGTFWNNVKVPSGVAGTISATDSNGTVDIVKDILDLKSRVAALEG